ncbi:hypothetical protein PanWU01x14_171030, partial [Parasponia andersonii]
MLQAYFRTRRALIDTIVSKIFDDDESATLSLLASPTITEIEVIPTIPLDSKTPNSKTIVE